MKRLFIVGKNNELPREAFSRTVWQHDRNASHQTRQTVFHSGTKPESAAAGSRAPTTDGGRHRPDPLLPVCFADLEPPQPWLEVQHTLEEVALVLTVAGLAVACMVVGWL